MLKKYFLIVFAILVVCYIYFLLDNDKYEKKKFEDGILVSFSTDKKTYAIDEAFTITYEIKNISPFPQRIYYGEYTNFLYDFLEIEPRNYEKFYEINDLESYSGIGVIGRTQVSLKPGKSLRLVTKYSPKGNIKSHNVDKMTFSSDFEGSTLDIKLSFPIHFKE